MSTNQTEALLVGDSDGNYYVIPRDAIDQYRVSDAYRSEIAQMMGGDEVSGYAHPVLNWLGRSLTSSAQAWAWASACYMPDPALFDTLYAHSERQEHESHTDHASPEPSAAP